ncbi:hypothetical protein FSHL1_005081 [Fusarium sambucinum]
MDSSRPYYRYGYYSNADTPPPIESFDDSASVAQSSGYGKRRDFVSSLVEGYGSNLPQDNPFTPHTNAGAETEFHSTQEYGGRGYLSNRPTGSYNSNTQFDNPFLPQQSSAGGSAPINYSQGYVSGREFPNSSVEDYHSNLRFDNPFITRQSNAGGGAQFQTTQGYVEHSEPSYSPVQDYRQSSGYDQMENFQSRSRYRTIYPQTGTTEAYAPQGFDNSFEFDTSSSPPRNIPTLGYESGYRTNEISNNPFASSASTAQSHYSQAPYYQSASTGPSYNQGRGSQSLASEYHDNRQYGGSYDKTQQDRQNQNQYTPRGSRAVTLFCVNCKLLTKETAVRCGPCNKTHQRNIVEGMASLETRYCIICRVPISGLDITCKDHRGRKHINIEQKRLIAANEDLCRYCFSCERKTGGSV